MDTGKARDLYEKFAGSMAFVEISNENREVGIGSAFHVGDGVFVTAKHVVEHNVVLQVGMTHRTRVTLTGEAALTSKTVVNIGGKSFPSHYVENSVL